MMSLYSSGATPFGLPELALAKRGKGKPFLRLLQEARPWLLPMIANTYRFSKAIGLPFTRCELRHEAHVLLYAALQRTQPHYQMFQVWAYLKKHVRYGLWGVVRRAYCEPVSRLPQRLWQQLEQMALFKQVSVLDKLLKAQEHDHLHRCIQTYLPPHEQDYLHKRYGLGEAQPQALKELAAEIGVTPQALCNREKRLLKRLKRFLNAGEEVCFAYVKH